MVFQPPTTTKSAYNGWITGDMPGLKHEAYLASGAYGQVHKVPSVPLKACRYRCSMNGPAGKILRIFGDLTKEDVDNEASVISQLCRPGASNTVVEVYDHRWLPGPDPSYYYIDMEFCPQTLEEWIYGPTRYKDSERGMSLVGTEASPSTTTDPATTGEFVSEQVLDILQNIACGLEYLHPNGIVHRDLKPRNVLFSLRDQRWKLADFGSSSQATSKRLNTTRFSRGTSSYRAPEIILEDSRYNNKADMFAFGCIIYEVVTCRKLFAGDVAVWEYASRKEPLILMKWPDCVIGSRLHALGRLTQELVHIVVSKRPAAVEVVRKLELMRGINRQENQSSDKSKDPERAHDNADQVPSATADDRVALFTPLYAHSSGLGIGGYDVRDPNDRAFAFDYLHSGTPDHLVLYRPGTGTLWILRNNNGDFQPAYQEGCPGHGIGGYDLASPVDRVFAFDYEHSGKSDYLVLYRRGTGTVWILQNDGGKFAPVYEDGHQGIGGFDLSGSEDRVFAFDFEHSGKLDHLVLYRPLAGTMVILKNNDGLFTSVYAGSFTGSRSNLSWGRHSICRAFAFDYSRTGNLDHILVYRSDMADPRVSILQNKNGVFTSISSLDWMVNQYHSPFGRILPYDYEGTGKADHLVLYWPGLRPGVIDILRSDGDTFTAVDSHESPGSGIGGYDLQSPNDRIFPFPYFPNGRSSQLCLYRPGHGTFWILRRF